MDHFALRQRDDPSGAEQFLKLIQDPFKSAFQVNAVWASLGASAGISILLALLFSVFRPRHTLVYAPKVKHADRRHTPPPVGKGFFAWMRPVLRTREPELVECIGLDATVFLRFTKMCRNIFIILSIIGCGVMIPVNLTKSNGSGISSLSAFATMTPLYVTTEAIWSQVICAWAFDIIIAYFLWRNYKAVTALRRKYFQSSDYQRSLHARTLMITDIPNEARSDEALMRLVDEFNPTAALPRASIGRNVKDLPVLIKEHEETVRQLESVLAKYFKRPDQLPAKRPTMRPSKKQRGNHPDCKVDAIDYLTDRIQRLEEEIRHVRASIDKRNAMPFGFVSWDMIEHAHAVAYTARKKHPKGTTIQLAPRPNDLIWENLPLSKQARKWKRFMNFIWTTLLTVVWIAPNAMIAIFLSNLSNLGLVWPAFQTSLSANPEVWAAVQGILSPAITSLVYLLLPIIFRRLSIKAGDVTKTSREGHVLSHLYSFFVFNNLIVFSLFSAAWTFVAAVVDAKNHDEDAWQAIKDGAFYQKVMSALCQVSPFWVTWLLQRNLGAAIDLVQLVTLFWVWFSKTFLAPTPRQAIEWTAPPPFDYASYYNYFLFYSTVALCFATLQPIVLPVTALYFGLDAMLKKYLLLYVFVTKTESGGQFWRALFNRLVFATILSNVIIALVAKTKGTWTMVYCVVPLPFLMLAFKFYCMKTFDDEIKYYNRANLTDAEAFAVDKSGKKGSDRLSSKFGHPALYKPLITPMVHAKAAEALKQIYRGRLGSSDVQGEYSDIAMDPMSTTQPGKAMDAGPSAPFEVVPENHLDFSYFKDRPDFRDEFGGGIYGRPEDLMTERSHTPRSHLAEWSPSTSRASSPTPSLPSLSGLKMPEGYDPIANDIHPAFRPPLSREESAAMGTGLYHHRSASESQQLLSQAQVPGTSEITPAPLSRWRTGGYGPVEQDDPNFTSYEHYRPAR
ncbi:uncharacterized protein C354.08c [Aspergillus lentulus]|uniref:Uncharacterized protein C354.08c n=1 Tax=Aspergillus lentulus TaxID=293939 RepID=A0AAN5YHH6_ASPLE|nr:uncharacterized protein C354.08c [Aspergillus lentulus]KAF4158790.1 hypothetical protein CNMCM6069_003356 [Aspergillus lentulus]KAF4162578.1 hypothetical protein CNMCM6936_001956 [Aspergillus lentulus]KAF4173229.1 hypothetical protein CNMCM8060_000461 [Aspergillus lentulus]KAF4183632.1 hypothetical protein CNMCM7927_008944 [Aspergillus lentulus]KAF4196791.1 hypothetical protein CNMCM8694_004286 [Aspergillus lentulus]